MLHIQRMENVFYVYQHIRPDTGRVFYIGKGKDRRAYWRNGRNRHWKAIASAHGFQVVIVSSGLSEQEAFDLEVKLIAKYGRFKLANYTNGGDGASGAKKTEAFKQMMKEKMKGRIFSEETIERMKMAAKNRSKESILRQAVAISGRKLTLEHKSKIAASCRGKIVSSESRKKISDFHKGKKKKPEAVAKMAASKSKRVLCLTNCVVYQSISEAARSLGLSQSAVSRVCNGQAKGVKGYTFKRI